jgi:hypothetical protein
MDASFSREEVLRESPCEASLLEEIVLLLLSRSGYRVIESGEEGIHPGSALALKFEAEVL